MTNYASGLSQIHNFESSTHLRGDRIKTFFVKKDETKTLVILTPSVADVRVYYRHSWFDPRDRDRKAMDFHMPCTVVDKDPAPQVCKACSRQLLDDRVKRSMRAVLHVVDRTVTAVEGKEWGDTPKFWELTKQAAAIFEKMFERYSKGRPRCQGLIVEVGRFGDQAPSCGNTFQFIGMQDPYQYFSRSPRVPYYIDKVRRLTKQEMTPDQAVREFFAPQDGRVVTEPDAIREMRFLNYVDMKLSGGGMKPADSFGYQSAPTQGGYGYNQPASAPVSGWQSNFQPQQPVQAWAPPPVQQQQPAPPVQQQQPAPPVQQQQPAPQQLYSDPAYVGGTSSPPSDFGAYAYQPTTAPLAVLGSSVSPQGVPPKWEGQAAFPSVAESFGVVTDVPPQQEAGIGAGALTPSSNAPEAEAIAGSSEADQVDQVAADVIGGDAHLQPAVKPIDFDSLV